MKATVDQDTCIGCGACIEAAPEVYSWNENDKAQAFEGPLPEDLQDKADEGAEVCPVDAITIDE